MEGINKIFGCGLSRTSSNSLDNFLNAYGFKSLHFHGYYIQQKHLDEYQCFIGSKSCMFDYEYYYLQYPNSKFIYTDRDSLEWAERIWKWWRHEDKSSYIKWHMNEEVYGRRDTVEELQLFYEFHKYKFVNFFEKVDKNAYLVLPMRSDDKAKQITDFLGIQKKHGNYPHNTSLKGKFRG